MDGPCHYTLAEGERIGFCFPVHAWRPPILVRRFIQRLSFANAEGHYCFALCTAGDTTGESMRIFRQILAQRSLHLDAVYSLIMPESYVGLPLYGCRHYRQKKERRKTTPRLTSPALCNKLTSAKAWKKSPMWGDGHA